MTIIPWRTCTACFAQASFASVCSGDRSRGRKEVGDAARQGHDKGRGIVDDASDRASSIAHDIRHKVLWRDRFTSASFAAILKGIQIGTMPVGTALMMLSCDIVTLSALSLGVMVCQLSCRYWNCSFCVI